MNDIAGVLNGIDSSRARFKNFQPGVVPYGEPQLLKLVAARLNDLPQYAGSVRTMRAPDLLIRGQWALEVKIARPFGDNGRAAENWSVNLLRPYSGNTGLLGDCVKLQSMTCDERKDVIAIGYEHDPPKAPICAVLTTIQEHIGTDKHADELTTIEVLHVRMTLPDCKLRRDAGIGIRQSSSVRSHWLCRDGWPA